MKQLKMHSPDLTQANIDKLIELFPNCVAEAADADGVVKRSIDFDQLRQELSAKREPLRVVFRDAGFASDSVKINVEQIFKLMSPSTEIKTI